FRKKYRFSSGGTCRPCRLSTRHQVGRASRGRKRSAGFESVGRASERQWTLRPPNTNDDLECIALRTQRPFSLGHSPRFRRQKHGGTAKAWSASPLEKESTASERATPNRAHL